MCAISTNFLLNGRSLAMNGRISRSLWPAFTAVLTVALTLSGCSGTTPDDSNSSDSDTPEQTQSQNDDEVRTLPNGSKIKDGLHLRPGVELIKFPMDVAEGFDVDREARTIELTGDAAEAARNQGADRGDVIAGVNGPEKPVLTRVGKIDDQGDTIYIETRPFIFEQVFWGKWDYNVPLRLREAVQQAIEENDNIEPVEEDPYRTDYQKLLGIPSLSIVIGGEGEACASAPWGNQTNSDQSQSDSLSGGSLETCTKLTLSFPPGRNTMEFRGKLPDFTSPSGHSCSNPQFDPWWSPKTYCVSYVKMRTELNIRPTFRISVKASGNITPVDKQGVIYDQLLAAFPIGTTGIAIVPRFSLEWDAMAGAQAQSELWTEAAGTLQIPAGFEYSNVGGRTGPIPHSGDPPQIVNTSVQTGVDYSAGIYAETGLSANLEMTLGIAGLPNVFSITGPTLQGRTAATAEYVPVDSDPDRTSCAKADIGASVNLTASIGAEINQPFNWRLFTALEFNKELWSTTFFEWTGGGDYCPGSDEHGEDEYDPDEAEPSDTPPGRDSEPAFKIEAVWEQSDTDIDLFATPPNAGELAPGDTDGGWTHPFDVCQDSCNPTSEHAEAVIYHPADAAPSGNYSYRVENNGYGTTDVTVNVRRGERVLESHEITLSGGRSESFSGNYDPGQ
jgi:hypothetical protein